MFLTYTLLVALFALLCASQDFSCGPDKPCKIGCCGKNNVCGLGPTYCGKGNCTHECDAKSECDPGWGSEWSTKQKCPLNVCCSKFGFCGTTKEFCGSDDSVKAPSCGGTSSTQRTIGYYEGWSSTRKCDGVFPEQLSVSGYSHINFAFAYIDPTTYQVAPMDTSQEGLWERVTALRETNPGLHIWISIGGWSMNDPDQPTAKTFSNLAASKDHQETFAGSLLSFMNEWGFDGVDLDWEYPVAPERGGKDEDFDNYPTFLANLRSSLAASGSTYGLSITLPSSYWYMKDFDIVKLEKSVDWFNMMTYDLHGTWDSTDRFIGAIAQAHTNLTEIDQALDLLWRNKIDPSKVVMGLGFYGRSFTLTDPSCSKAGCPFSAGGNPGPCTATAGILSYDEIQDILAKGAKVVEDQDAAVQIATWGGNQWVSFDDKKTFGTKIDYANKHCLGGTMAWAVDLDKNGSAIDALSNGEGSHSIQKRSGLAHDSVGSCKWTDCINPNKICPGVGGGGGQPCVPTCPEGSSPAWSNSGKGVCDSGSYRLFCCPNNEKPKCQIEKEAQYFCNGRCTAEQVQIGSDYSGCLTGQNAICCRRSQSLAAQEECAWQTKCQSPDAVACPGDKPNLIASTIEGDGGKICSKGQTYQYCCSNPSPYTNCKWDYGPFGGSVCQGACSQDQVVVATTSNQCSSGSGVLCCDASLNGDAVNQFQLKVSQFVKEPTCPAKEVVLYDEAEPASFTEPESQDFKRNVNTISKRDYSSFGGFEMVLNLPAIFSGQSDRAKKETAAWDKIAGKTNLLAKDYVEIYNSYPEYDPAVLTLQYLCSWDQASFAIQESNHAEVEACELIGEGATHEKRNLVRNTTIEDRTFRPALSDTRAPSYPGAAINTGALMDAINNGGNVHFLYTRTLNYQGLANLEVVYDLRNRPDLQQRRGVDIFAVFHFHINELTDLDDPNEPFAQIPFFHVFHGQRVFNANRDDRNNPAEWRVDYGRGPSNTGPGGANQRTPVLRCPTGQAWYPGHQVAAGGAQNAIVQNFGATLRGQGILGQRSLPTWHNGRWIWDPSRGSSDWPNDSPLANGPADMTPQAGWPTQ